MNKKALTLIELIFSITILSIVIIGSLRFISASYGAYNGAKSNIIVELELKSSLKLISKKLSHSSDLVVYNDILEWNEIDYRGFRAKQYSGYSDLNISNNKVLISPNSDFSKSKNIKNSMLKMGDKTYQIKDSKNDKIYFKDTSNKTITQTYLLISAHYTIRLDNGSLKLYKNDFNSMNMSKGYLILKDVSKFKISKNGNILDIKICINEDKICSSKAIIID